MWFLVQMRTRKSAFEINWSLEGKQASMQIHQSGTLRRTCSMACKLLLFFSPLTCFFNMVSNVWRSDTFIDFDLFVCMYVICGLSLSQALSNGSGLWEGISWWLVMVLIFIFCLVVISVFIKSKLFGFLKNHLLWN